jgi:hypothetical protein
MYFIFRVSIDVREKQVGSIKIQVPSNILAPQNDLDPSGRQYDGTTIAFRGWAKAKPGPSIPISRKNTGSVGPGVSRSMSK